MELSKRINLNPLKCNDTTMLPSMLLMSKLVVIGYILKGYVSKFHEVHTPFFNIFYIFPELGVSSHLYVIVLQFIFYFAGACLLFNVKPRASAFILSATIFFSIASHQYNYSNNQIYVATIFLWASLIDGEKDLWLFRLQLFLVYFGAGFNKAFEPDWISGQYMDHLMRNITLQPKYDFWAGLMPPFVFAKLMGIGSIVCEFALAFLFLFKKYNRFAVVLAILFHSVISFFAYRDYGIFSIALFSSYMVLLPWPKTIGVFINSKKIMHTWIRRLFSFFDLDRRLDWFVREGDELEILFDNKKYHGITAFKLLILCSTVTFFIIMLVMCYPSQGVRAKVLMVLLLLFSPLLDIIFEIINMKKRKCNL